MTTPVPAEFSAAALSAVRDVPASLLDRLADAWQDDRPGPSDSATAELRAAIGDLPRPVAAGWLRGALAAHRHDRQNRRIEAVWSGPHTSAVPVRATPRVMTELIDTAGHELVITTYSAKPYPPIVTALKAAVRRGVVVDIVVETLDGAGHALSGTEPAAAFAEVIGVRLWHWPRGNRPTAAAKMHAKLAVADRRTLFVSSVNLTTSGIEHSIEAGVVIRGGHAPERFAEHIRSLCRQGVLDRWWP